MGNRKGNARLAAVAALALAAAAAGCVSPDDGPPLPSPLLAEREGPGGPVRWYLAEGGVLVEAVPLDPPAPSLGIETEEWSAGGNGYVRVTALREDGWGGDGRIRPGEDLLGVAGRAVRSAAEVDEALAATEPGGTVEVLLGSPRGVRVAEAVAGRRSDLRRTKLPAFMERRRTGLSFCLLEGETSTAVYGDPEPRILLSRVPVGSPAWRAGLRRGDRVLSVEGRAPATPQEALGFLRGPPGHPAAIEVEGPGGPLRFEFRREEDVEAPGGFGLPLIAGSTGDRRYWSSWLLGGLLWSRVEVNWNVPGREPASASETGSLLWLFRLRSSPEESTMWLLGIPFRLR